jgi:ankyrin repeat protein
MNSRGNEIHHATPGTCKWLLQNETYMDWVSRRRGLLWIKGKPGAGKSTIMKFCLETLDNSDRKSRGIFTVSFFFHARGSNLQKTPEGLFRAVLHQLLEHFPKSLSAVVENFRSKCRSMGKAGEKWSWHPKELESFIVRSLPTLLEISSIRIFVDALDECGGETARELVESFQRLYAASSLARHPLSICFSCRHYPIIAPERCLEVCIESNNYDDISRHVSERLQEVAREPMQFADIQYQIESGSNGVFLWAVLVTRLIISEYRDGKTPRQLEEALLKVPQTLDDLFDDILAKLPEKDRSRSLKLFQWICLSQRPLNVSELRSAMNIDADPTRCSFREWETSADFIHTDEQMIRQLNSLSCGLAEIQQREKPIVQLIHESVRDYLFMRGFCSFENTMLSRDLIAGMAHIRLLRSCVIYFSMDEIKAETSPEMYTWTYNDREKAKYSGELLSTKYPLLEYALLFWLHHIGAAEKVGFLKGDLLGAVQKPWVETMQLWVSLGLLMDIHDILRRIWARSWTIIHVAAIWNLESVILTVLDKSDTICIEANPPDFGGRTPLGYAAGYGHEAMVKLLIESGAQPDLKDKLGYTPLSLAAACGQEAVVKLLLELGGVNVDAVNRCGHTPLSRASEQGQKTVVELLLAHGALPDMKDILQRTPLFLAASRGEEAVVKLLLEQSFVNVNAKDQYGHTPLSIAAEEGHKTVVELLLAHGAKDVGGVSALSCAERKGHESVIELLLMYGAQPNSMENRGQTSLLHVMEGRYKTVIQV